MEHFDTVSLLCYDSIYYKVEGFMRYHIDTIPVWDAVKLLGECPLCAIRRRNELHEIQRFLGGSVMEPDTRIQVNDKGFCKHHQQMLFKESNKLGHALMLHTHLCETEKKLNEMYDKAIKASTDLSSAGIFQRVSGKTNAPKDVLKSIADNIQSINDSCIICDSLNENMKRYAYTFLHLFKTDKEFKKAIESSKGVCLPDFALLLRIASDILSGKQLADFVETLVMLQKENLKRIEDEVQFFTLKFDYRNQDKPWGDSKDAVERTVNKLQGYCVGEDPYPKDKR